MYKDDDILYSVQSTPFFEPSCDATVSSQDISIMMLFTVISHKKVHAIYADT